MAAQRIDPQPCVTCGRVTKNCGGAVSDEWHNVDEPAVWAPAWCPAVGDQVRVRLSPECRCYAPRLELYPAMAGATGVVDSVLPEVVISEIRVWPRHIYVVRFDTPLAWRGGPAIRHSSFARAELEPAAWAGPGEWR